MFELLLPDFCTDWQIHASRMYVGALCVLYAGKINALWTDDSAQQQRSFQKVSSHVFLYFLYLCCGSSVQADWWWAWQLGRRGSGRSHTPGMPRPPSPPAGKPCSTEERSWQSAVSSHSSSPQSRHQPQPLPSWYLPHRYHAQLLLSLKHQINNIKYASNWPIVNICIFLCKSHAR